MTLTALSSAGQIVCRLYLSLGFSNFFFSGLHRSLGFRGGLQWWNVILVDIKGPTVSMTCHSLCWPWGPCGDGIKYGITLKSRVSGGAQGPEWALSCDPLPALTSWTLVTLLPFVLVLPFVSQAISASLLGHLLPTTLLLPFVLPCSLPEAHCHRHPVWLYAWVVAVSLPRGQALEGGGFASFSVSSAPVTVSGT